MPKLVVGCGYLGRRVARQWLADGCQVYATTRDRRKADRLAEDGLKPIVCDLLQTNTFVGLPDVETVLFAVGYDRTAGSSIHEVYVEGLRNVLSALPPTTKRIVYISSTGVYGSSDGDWLDESSPCNPTREGGKACLAAERLLSEHPLGSRAIVLRLAGLYGPGRIPRRADLLAGKPIAAPSRGWLNLIHVDDAAAVVLAAETKATPPALFLVSDGRPVLRGDYYGELARLLGAAEPQFEPPAEDSPVAQRASADKRIDNSHLLEMLQIQLAYPSYREALAAIVREEEEKRQIDGRLG